MFAKLVEALSNSPGQLFSVASQPFRLVKPRGSLDTLPRTRSLPSLWGKGSQCENVSLQSLKTMALQ